MLRTGKWLKNGSIHYFDWAIFTGQFSLAKRNKLPEGNTDSLSTVQRFSLKIRSICESYGLRSWDTGNRFSSLFSIFSIEIELSNSLIIHFVAERSDLCPTPQMVSSLARPLEHLSGPAWIFQWRFLGIKSLKWYIYIYIYWVNAGWLWLRFRVLQDRFRADNRRGMTLQDSGPVFLSAPCSISPAEEGAAASVRCGASPRSAPHSVATDGKYLNLGDMIHRTSTVGNWSTQSLLKNVYNIYILFYIYIYCIYIIYIYIDCPCSKEEWTTFQHVWSV